MEKGDVFVVRPGENIPVDGIVLGGISAVDESTLTGESIPVDKSAGSLISAGTMNQSGFLRCEATRVDEDTTLSQIIQMVSDAAATKVPIAKVADKVFGVFVPAVIAIAARTVIVCPFRRSMTDCGMFSESHPVVPRFACFFKFLYNQNRKTKCLPDWQAFCISRATVKSNRKLHDDARNGAIRRKFKDSPYNLASGRPQKASTGLTP